MNTHTVSPFLAFLEGTRGPILFAALLLFLVGGCAAQPGDCPSPDDCACPCSDSVQSCVSTDGQSYLNQCMLECDGAEVASCANSPLSESCPECELEDDDEPVCGSIDDVHQFYPNKCFRECAGAKKEKDKKCE